MSLYVRIFRYKHMHRHGLVPSLSLLGLSDAKSSVHKDPRHIGATPNLSGFKKRANHGKTTTAPFSWKESYQKPGLHHGTASGLRLNPRFFNLSTGAGHDHGSSPDYLVHEGRFIVVAQHQRGCSQNQPVLLILVILVCLGKPSNLSLFEVANSLENSNAIMESLI